MQTNKSGRITECEEQSSEKEFESMPQMSVV